VQFPFSKNNGRTRCSFQWQQGGLARYEALAGEAVKGYMANTQQAEHKGSAASGQQKKRRRV
jgi:hypothetical protein